MKTIHYLATAAVLLGTTMARSQDAKFNFPEERIPRFNIPQISKAPTIDGHIDPAEWQEAVRVMGVAWTSSLDYRDRPVSFWVAWDAGHLYLAARSDVLPGHRLYRSNRRDLLQRRRLRRFLRVRPLLARPQQAARPVLQFFEICGEFGRLR